MRAASRLSMRGAEPYGAAIVKLRDCGAEDLSALLVAVKSTV